jgi:hypothetical protein
VAQICLYQTAAAPLNTLHCLLPFYTRSIGSNITTAEKKYPTKYASASDTMAACTVVYLIKASERFYCVMDWGKNGKLFPLKACLILTGAEWAELFKNEEEAC